MPRGGPRFTVLHKAAKPDRFVRTLPPPEKPSPLHVLAWFRMGEDDPGAKAGQPAGEQTINRGHRYHLKKYGSPTYTADTAAPGSSLAMNFSGAEGEYFYTRYLCWSPDDNFILEAWVRPNRARDRPCTSSTTVAAGRTAMAWLMSDGQWYCLRGAMAESPGEFGRSMRSGQMDPSGIGARTRQFAVLDRRPACQRTSAINRTCSFLRRVFDRRCARDIAGNTAKRL